MARQLRGNLCAQGKQRETPRTDKGKSSARMSRRRSRAGGGATNRSTDVTADAPEPAPRSRSLPLPALPEEERGAHAGEQEFDICHPAANPDDRGFYKASSLARASARGLGESFQESHTHHSWRGFPRRRVTGSSSARGWGRPGPPPRGVRLRVRAAAWALAVWAAARFACGVRAGAAAPS